jgi:hypothetical protein
MQLQDHVLEQILPLSGMVDKLAHIVLLKNYSAISLSKFKSAGIDFGQIIGRKIKQGSISNIKSPPFDT